MQQRPPGIVLSAIALGLVAFFLLLLSLGGAVTLLGGSRLPAGTGAASLPPAALPAFMAGITLVYLLLAAWCVATLAGLVRMRPWARASAMVIAGGIAGLGLLSALSMAAMQSAFASGGMPLPPSVSPALLHKVIFLIEAASSLAAGLAIGWLVYLAKRRTRDAFVQAQHRAHLEAQRQARPDGVPPPYGSPAWGPPSGTPFPPSAFPGRAPNPLTDFTVARPLDAPLPSAEPLAPATTQDAASVPAPDAAEPLSQAGTPYKTFGQPPTHAAPPAGPAYPAPPARSGRPVSVTVLAIIALVGAFFSLFQVVSPLPVFLFGMILSGWPVHVYGIVWSAALAIAGLGMLRLQRPAWLLAFVLLGISALHFLALVLPGARAHYVVYMQMLERQAPTTFHQAALPPAMQAVSIAAGVFFGMAAIALAGVLLWRARWAFAAAPPSPGDTSAATPR